MFKKHLDIRELIALTRDLLSTSYTEALIDGLELAIKLDRGEVTVKTAFKQVVKASRNYVESRRSM
ncbi:MAG: hypothetical protein E3J73_05115 [Candidatus Bathyarchaeum sp.]|nr:MAG: hypothetical protein E3J73_05115 [Candidatus Bathyarchaeum sp.]